MGRFIVAAVLGLMLGASGPADAGVIFTTPSRRISAVILVTTPLAP
jgi:hypothetical protein